MLAVSNYHYIRDNFESDYPSIYGLTPKQFENQLVELSKGASFISQSELVQFSEKPFDKNYLLITFDDGLSEQYELAKPILNRLGIPFVFFINTANHTNREVSLVHKIHLVRSKVSPDELLDYINNEKEIFLSPEEKILAQENYNYDLKNVAYLKYLLNFKLSLVEQKKVIDPVFQSLFSESLLAKKMYFSEEQLATLNQEDALGSHSHQHIPLGIFDEGVIEEELQNTQHFFTSRFGKNAYSISYPYGSFEACNKVSDLCKEYDFKLGFSMERAASKEISSNPLMISRFDCNDMPTGKNSLFHSVNDLFSNADISKWYK